MLGTKVGKIAGQRWKEMTEEEKQPFIAAWRGDKAAAAERREAASVLRENERQGEARRWQQQVGSALARAARAVDTLDARLTQRIVGRCRQNVAGARDRDRERAATAL
eukprot:SAG11_NODE_22151_length_411_cov_0.810897_1_plen_107_part_01